MPENEQIQDTIARDIYRQYAMTLIAINDFVHDKYSEKYTLENAQKMMDLLAGIANKFLDEKIKKEDKIALNELFSRQKKFVAIEYDKKELKNVKSCAREIIEEYNRLCLKSRVFNISS
jgi:GTPase SAR1 family protein